MYRSLAAASCAVLIGCGTTAHEPAPRRSAIPALVYHGITDNASAEDVTPEQFERQMDLLADAGYRTIGLATLAAFLRGEHVRLPARPFVLTFDDGRRSSRAGADAILKDHGFAAAIFVDAGRVDAGTPGYLSWHELDELHGTRRWDVQLEAGTGKFLIRYGSGAGDVGPFYAYRGEDEVLGGWRERVFGDISWAERQLALRMRNYRPLAFSPPYGNYGQVGTNDPQIPRLLLTRLHDSFPLVLTQDRDALARRGQGTAEPIGRLALTSANGDRDLRALLAAHASSQLTP